MKTTSPVWFGAAFVCSLLAVHPATAQKAFSPPRLTDGKPDLNGIWEVRGKVDADIEGRIGGKNIIVDPANGKIPYKPEALMRKKQNFDARAQADPVAKCFQPGVPRMMYMPYPLQIVRAADQPSVLILSPLRSHAPQYFPDRRASGWS